MLRARMAVLPYAPAVPCDNEGVPRGPLQRETHHGPGAHIAMSLHTY
jgi:hypothetical protein